MPRFEQTLNVGGLFTPTPPTATEIHRFRRLAENACQLAKVLSLGNAHATINHAGPLALQIEQLRCSAPMTFDTPHRNARAMEWPIPAGAFLVALLAALDALYVACGWQKVSMHERPIQTIIPDDLPAMLDRIESAAVMFLQHAPPTPIIWPDRPYETAQGKISRGVGGLVEFHDRTTVPDAATIGVFKRAVPGFDEWKPDWAKLKTFLMSRRPMIDNQFEPLTVDDLKRETRLAMDGRPASSTAKGTKTDAAIGYLTKNPGATMSAVASAVGAKVQTLSASQRFRKVWDLMRPEENLRHGFRKDDGTIEAIDEE